MEPLDELALMLRPAAGGLVLYSTGRAEQLALQRRLYQVESDADVEAAFRATLGRIASARVVLLGIPSDVGAGFLRGANLGPQALREALLAADPSWPTSSAQAGVVDIGDVVVVPQLLHDEMLSEHQLAASRRALYPGITTGDLPVSPLSIAERVLDQVLSLNPGAKPLVLGGDHSAAWPVVAALSRRQREPWAIVQIDAHTDLLEERLGVRLCFGTWSYHANELLGRGGRLVQVGVRASRHDQSHWERTLGVRQFWASTCRAQPSETIDQILAHLHQRGIKSVYFSNDIDGTDATYADATGTAEPGGLEPEFVSSLLARLGAELDLIGGDLMEVAPPLRRSPDGPERTVHLGARYVRETARALLGQLL